MYEQIGLPAERATVNINRQVLEWITEEKRKPGRHENESRSFEKKLTVNAKLLSKM